MTITFLSSSAKNRIPNLADLPDRPDLIVAARAPIARACHKMQSWTQTFCRPAALRLASLKTTAELIPQDGSHGSQAMVGYGKLTSQIKRIHNDSMVSKAP